ncbi:MAG: hypothetical protein HY447_03935 [Candidatus Omnitrophica bacterium]|nr:hypothetical protein [Candidatus Omnitrophota bacterium]
MTKEPYLFFDIDKGERDSAIRFLLSSILRSRLDGDFNRLIEEFDEDVNVYLAHLLFAVALPEYHELSEPYLSTESSDVLRWVKATEDRTIRYFIFKVNADHLLVHLSIFGDLTAKPWRGIFRKSQRHFVELGRLYYEQAANYHSRIYRKRTGVGDVLEKLGRNFDAYSGLLKLVRRDYLHFVTRFRDQAFDKFLEELSVYERESTKRARIDYFLDLYSEWLKTKDPALKTKADQAFEELKKTDPHFGKGPSHASKAP